MPEQEEAALVLEVSEVATEGGAKSYQKGMTEHLLAAPDSVAPLIWENVTSDDVLGYFTELSNAGKLKKGSAKTRRTSIRNMYQ
ncbi:unnamed protein product, partial [Phaeothamnion confervicola]